VVPAALLRAVSTGRAGHRQGPIGTILLRGHTNTVRLDRSEVTPSGSSADRQQMSAMLPCVSESRLVTIVQSIWSGRR
jgi:hypothetical protein